LPLDLFSTLCYNSVFSFSDNKAEFEHILPYVDVATGNGSMAEENVRVEESLKVKIGCYFDKNNNKIHLLNIHASFCI
jgi:hypothetical protein